MTGHSVASTTPYSASPKPRVLPGDVVIPDAGRDTGEEPLPESFLEALARALGLRDADMDVLRATDPDRASPFVANTLCAVRWCSCPCSRLRLPIVFALRQYCAPVCRLRWHWEWSLMSTRRLMQQS